MTNFTRYPFRGTPSTRIYCRDSCSYWTKYAECFPSHAAAEQAGYRPCLHCRPELVVPSLDAEAGWDPAWRAAAWIRETLSLQGFASLAKQLGTTEPELAAQCEEKLGTSPIALLKTSRLLFAKMLLTDTELPLSTIVRVTGGGTLSKWCEHFKKCYRIDAKDLRPRTQPRTDGGIRLSIAYRDPFDFQAMLLFLRVRAIPGVERVTETEYRRILQIRGTDGVHRGWIRVSQAPQAGRLSLWVSKGLHSVLSVVWARVCYLFDLGAEPSRMDAQLESVAQYRSGLRVPGAVDPLETAVRAVLGQQITVSAARTLAGRVAHTLGSPIETADPELHCVFPDASALSAASQDQLGRLGILRIRVAAIHSLANWCQEDQYALTPWLEPMASLKRMKTFPGIGDWTAQYVAMRALKWADAFPAADYGVLHSLGVKKATDARKLAEAWKPWRSYAVMQLWHRLSTP